VAFTSKNVVVLLFIGLEGLSGMAGRDQFTEFQPWLC
jgi:hypothetical protein